MSEKADALDRLARRLLVEARGLDEVAGTVEPLIALVVRAWEGPAADRLISELDARRGELVALVAGLRGLADRYLEKARRLRVAAEPEAVPGAGEMLPR